MILLTFTPGRGSISVYWSISGPLPVTISVSLSITLCSIIEPIPLSVISSSSLVVSSIPISSHVSRVTTAPVIVVARREASASFPSLIAPGCIRGATRTPSVRPGTTTIVSR
uniref:Uncharacterized protein n=1 Tax=Cacopsylla melanoneura TaxID=428564 RepID=A0A8D8ZU37_9HEMI